MDLISIFISIVSLIVVMLLGVVSRTTHILARDDKKVLSAYIYYFALPALFFTEIAQIDFTELEPILFIGSVLPVGIIFGLLILIYTARLISKDQFIISSVCVVFGSNAFFGVAFFEALWGSWGFHTSVLTASALGMVGIVLSVLLFEYATQEKNAATIMVRVGRSPLILSVVLGMCFSLLNLKLTFLFTALSLVGRTAAGCAIFLLGMFIYDNFSRESVTRALTYSLVRLVLLPVAILGVLLFYGDLAAQLKIFLFLQGGIPAAISIAVLADRYNYKAAELAGVVIVTSLLSFVSLSVLYWLAYVLF